MERIEGTQVLLLQDHLQDEEKVHGLLVHLDALNTIRVIRKEGRTLSFFADEHQEPAAIIMFLNSNAAYGVYFSDNFYLLGMKTFGTERLRRRKCYKVALADARATCLKEFLSKLIAVKVMTNPMLN